MKALPKMKSGKTAEWMVLKLTFLEIEVAALLTGWDFNVCMDHGEMPENCAMHVQCNCLKAKGTSSFLA